MVENSSTLFNIFLIILLVLNAKIICDAGVLLNGLAMSILFSVLVLDKILGDR